ncbi:hypothetical protein LSAT2_012930 [Lamellibrachia satsuma]|nr:hypothetical protein LSAT2_012930 [Lamellibrachia satsuma]
MIASLQRVVSNCWCHIYPCIAAFSPSTTVINCTSSIMDVWVMLMCAVVNMTILCPEPSNAWFYTHKCTDKCFKFYKDCSFKRKSYRTRPGQNVDTEQLRVITNKYAQHLTVIELACLTQLRSLRSLYKCPPFFSLFGDNKVMPEVMFGDNKVMPEVMFGDNKVMPEVMFGDNKVMPEVMFGDNKVMPEVMFGDNKVMPEVMFGDNKVMPEVMFGDNKVMPEVMFGDNKVMPEVMFGDNKVMPEVMFGDNKVMPEVMFGDNKVMPEVMFGDNKVMPEVMFTSYFTKLNVALLIYLYLYFPFVASHVRGYV